MEALLKALKSQWDIRSMTDSKEPLYHQLFLLLKACITNGTVEYGAQMPTEQQLSSTFDLSRITVKRAMDELAAENLIARRRGTGSHVIHEYRPEPVRSPLVGMLANVDEMSKHSKVKVLSIDNVSPPAQTRQLLGLDDGETATRIVRVRTNESAKPYAYYTSWTRVSKGVFTKRKIESKTRLSILREEGIKIAKVEQTLSAENAQPDVAKLLSIQAGDALLALERHSFDENGQLIDLLFGLYNPKLFTYKMEMGLD